jgi:GcrA cell cycle regulator
MSYNGTPSSSPWLIPGRIEQLKNLTAEGYSASEIANEFGVTRNAVIGKQTRLGLARSQSKQNVPKVQLHIGVTEHDTVAKIVRKKTKPKISIAPSPANQVTPLKIGFMKMNFGTLCAYVLDEKGDDGLALYCGHPKYGALSFCFGHSAIVYTEFRCEALQA